MMTYKLDILLVAEAHNNNNPIETHGNYGFAFSSDVTEEQKEKADDIRSTQKQTRKRQLQLLNTPKQRKLTQRSHLKTRRPKNSPHWSYTT